MQAQDPEKLNCQLAQFIAELTCNGKSRNKDSTHVTIGPELKDILTRIDARIEKLYKALPANALCIVSSGHGDTAFVRRCAIML